MPQPSPIRRASAGVAVACVVVASAGCGGGRIGEIASERAATAAIPLTVDAPVQPPTTASTSPPQSPGATNTGSDIAAAGTRFEQDLRSATTAIGSITAAVAMPITPGGAPAVVQQVSTLLRDYDAAVASLDAYRLPDAAPEQFRTTIVDSAPATSDAIRDFTERAQGAADANDQAALDAARLSLLDALSRFVGTADPRGGAPG